MIHWLIGGAALLVGYRLFTRPHYPLRKGSIVTTLRKGRTYDVTVVSLLSNGIPSAQEQQIITDQLQNDGWTIVRPISFTALPEELANLWKFRGTWDKPLIAVDVPTEPPQDSHILIYSVFENASDIKLANPTKLLKDGTYHYTARMNSTMSGKDDNGKEWIRTGIPSHDSVILAFQDAGFNDVIALHDISGNINPDPFVWFVQGKWAGSLLPAPIQGPFKNFHVLNVA